MMMIIRAVNAKSKTRVAMLLSTFVAVLVATVSVADASSAPEASGIDAAAVLDWKICGTGSISQSGCEHSIDNSHDIRGRYVIEIQSCFGEELEGILAEGSDEYAKPNVTEVVLTSGYS